MTPNPATAGQQVAFNAGASADPDGTIAKYEWDLDGNGTYETDTGTTATTTHTYATAGTVTVGLRVTDNAAATGTTTRTLTVNAQQQTSPYPQTILATTGLSGYWRLGEASGTTLADQLGAPADRAGRRDARRARARSPAMRTPPRASTASTTPPPPRSTCPRTNKLTVEFWLKWNAYANDDRLAMEFTPNFNDNAGGFLVDPNARQRRQVRPSASAAAHRATTCYFARPSAGAWHHYAFVIDTTAPAATQITPYVDGQAGQLHQARQRHRRRQLRQLDALRHDAATPAALFGTGDLDELAIYRRR